MGIPASMDPSFGPGEDQTPLPPRFVAADVENALMKNSSSNGAFRGVLSSTTTSVVEGEGDGEGDESMDMEKDGKDTPATSMSGDAGKSDEESDRIRVELQ
jgi:hypothetical protein